jgi:hypothetical protein
MTEDDECECPSCRSGVKPHKITNPYSHFSDQQLIDFLKENQDIGISEYLRDAIIERLAVLADLYDS